MGYKRRIRKTIKKNNRTRRTYRRKKKMFKGNQNIVKFGQQGLPRSIFTKLKFANRFQTTAITSGTTGLVFNMNSIFAVQESGTPPASNQPYMHDTYNTLYNYYRVYGAKVKIYCSTDQATDASVTLRNSTSSVIPASMNLEIERGGQYRMVTNERPITMKAYYSVSRTVGVNKWRVKNDDVFASTFGTNPVQRAYILFAVQSTDLASGAIVNSRIEITYYVNLFDRIQQNAS